MIAAATARWDSPPGSRARPDASVADALIARALDERRILPSRVDHWREALARNWDRAAYLLTAPPESGGLAALPVAAASSPPTAEESEHRAAFVGSFPREAAALGYALAPRRARIVDRS